MIVHNPNPPSQGCSACGGRLIEWMREVVDPQTGDTFSILRCDVCALGHTRPLPLHLDQYYGSAYYGLRHGPTGRFCAWRRRRILRRAAPRPGRLLDIGCGDGAFMRAAIGERWSVVGTEIGRAAEAATASGLRIESSLDAFTADDRFDAITLWHTLEHFPDPLDVLVRASRFLAPTGVMIIAVPDAGGLQASCFGASWFGLDVPRHLIHFNQAALAGLIGRSGLVAGRWLHQELEYDVFGWLQSALNVTLPTRNELFATLTGKPSRAGGLMLAMNYALAAVLAAPALAATAVGTAVGRGGTLIAIARKPSVEAHQSEA